MKNRIEQLRKEAKPLRDKGKYAFRSCWNCNGAHEHLKNAEGLINCFVCGHWFYKGEDLTEDDNET